MQLLRRSTPRVAPAAALLAWLVTVPGCQDSRAAQATPDTPAATSPDVPAEIARAAPSSAGEGPRSANAAAPLAARLADGYPWLGDPSIMSPPAVDALEDRFPSPPGFTRVLLAEGSFGAWLRRLPLAAPGTPVRTYAGRVLLPPDHPSLAAVVAIDPGAADLQHCADAIIRLHAEWRWSKGARDQRYRAGGGVELRFDRWLEGERPVQRGRGLSLERTARPAAPDHATFRRYLDGVFMWANTGSLAAQAEEIGVEEIAPGDFVVQPGAPGHAVLVLDMARAPDGRAALLLGQSFMPAQNVHVLRPDGEGAWFALAPGDEALRTPFWRPFPWRWLRRLGS
jgi:hypothetical protein